MNFKGWNRRSVVLAAVVAAGASLLGACDNLGGKKSADTGAGSGAGASAGGVIKVGHYASLTGNEATFGVSTDQGIKLAVAERNAAGGIKGRKIELITLDTASKASEGGTVVTRLITQEKVSALIGEVASSITLAGGDVAQKLGVPNISPSSTNVRVTELGDLVSRVCFTDDFQAWVVAKFLRDHLKLDKVAILFDNQQAYSKGLAEYFEKSWTAMGGKIVANEAYTGGNPDASAQLQTIKGSGAQALFLPGYYGDAGNFMKQAKQKGITIPFIGADGWDSTDLIKIAGDAANGHYFSNHYSTQEQRPEVVAFVGAYQAKYHALPDGLAALGYDAARVLFDAMDRAASLDGKTLGAAIAATKDFKGVTGLITMDAKRNAQKKAVVLQVEGGAFKWVTDIWPEGMGPAAPADGSGSGSAAPAPTPAPGSGSGSAADLGAPGTGTTAATDKGAPAATEAAASEAATPPAAKKVMNAKPAVPRPAATITNKASNGEDGGE